MKKRFLGILSVVMCAAIFLCSCGTKTGEWSEVFVDPYVNDAPKLTKVNEAEIFSDYDVSMSVVDTVEHLILFENNNAAVGQDAIVLFDALKGEIVSTWEKYGLNPSYRIATGIDGVVVNGQLAGYILRETVAEYDYTDYSTDYTDETTLYTLKHVFVETIEYTDSVRVVGTSVYFGENRYTFSGSSFRLDKSYNIFSTKPTVKVVGSYMYEEIKEDDDLKVINIYDSTYGYIATYEIPFADKLEYFILGNGNILVQGRIELPYDAEDYDLYEVGSEIVKYNLFTEVFKLEDKKVKKIDCDYIISDVTNKLSSENYVFNETFENVIEATEIIENRENKAQKKQYSMSNVGKIEDNIPSVIANQVEVSYSGVPGYYKAKDIAGNYYIVDEDGTVYGDITRYIKNNSIVSEKTNKHFILDGALYNFNLKLLEDVSDYSVYATSRNYVFFYENVDSAINYYVYRNNKQGIELIATTDNNERLYQVRDQYYIVEEYNIGNYDYTIFNEEGDELISNGIAFNNATSSKDGKCVVLYNYTGVAYVLK